MDVLNQSERVLNDLLADRCSDASEHEESRLDSVMRFDHVYGTRLIQFRCEKGCEEIATKITVIVGHKSVVGLGFDILKSRKECSIAKGIFKEGKTPAREDTCNRRCQHSLVMYNPLVGLLGRASQAVLHLSGSSTGSTLPFSGYIA